MTVCIAAHCQWEGQSAIVGVADRQLTAGDTKYETDRTKIGVLGRRIVALQSGIDSQYYEIFKDTYQVMRRGRVRDVRRVAGIYSDHYAKYRLQRAERLFLSPVGLTRKDLLTKRRDKLAPEILFHLFNSFYGEKARVGG